MIAAFALLAAVPLTAGSSSCDHWLQGLYGKLPYAEYSVVDRAARCLEGPTVAYEEPSFDPVGYWRGRTWVNMAYFALRGLKWYGYDEL